MSIPPLSFFVVEKLLLSSEYVIPKGYFCSIVARAPLDLARGVIWVKLKAVAVGNKRANDVSR